MMRTVVAGWIALAGLTALLHAEEKSLILRKIEEVRDNAKLERVDADFRALSATLKHYRLNAGVLPTEEQGLKALVEKPTVDPLPKRWIQLMAKVPLDAWDRPYHYSVRVKDGKREYVVSSDGPDAADKKDDLEKVVDAEKVAEKPE